LNNSFLPDLLSQLHVQSLQNLARSKNLEAFRNCFSHFMKPGLQNLAGSNNLKVFCDGFSAIL